MAVTSLFVELPRKTNNDHVAALDRLANLILPVLAREDLFAVQPNVDALFGDPPVQTPDRFLIAARINQEYMELFC
jgi:hypothetical protein